MMKYRSFTPKERIQIRLIPKTACLAAAAGLLAVCLNSGNVFAMAPEPGVSDLVASMTNTETLEALFPDISGTADGQAYDQFSLYGNPGEAEWYFEDGSPCFVEWSANESNMDPDSWVGIISDELSGNAYEYADDYYLWETGNTVLELAMHEAPMTIWAGDRQFYDRQDLLGPADNSGDVSGGSENADESAWFEAYRDIFSDYDYAISNHLSADMAPDTISYIADTSSADRVGFAFMDLNGDGISELLTGPVMQEENADPYIYDLYTLVNGAPVHLKSSWLRGRMYLAPEGRIYVSSLQQGTYKYDLFEVAGGASELKLYKRFTTDGVNSSLTAMDENGGERQLDPGENSDDYKTFCGETQITGIAFRPLTEWYAVK